MNNNGKFSFHDVWQKQREEENSGPTVQNTPIAEGYVDVKDENERVAKIGQNVQAFATYVRTIVDDEGNDIKHGKMEDAKSLIGELNKQLGYIAEFKNIIKTSENQERINERINKNMEELTEIKEDLDERLAALESFGGKSRKRKKRSKSSKKKSRQNKKRRRSIKKR
jgi:hypothetical protein